MSGGEKLIVVVGATGLQGGSVVDAFINLSPPWRVRALTRDATSSTAKALAAKSSKIEVVTANLNDLASLKKAFEGATAIFGVTDFWAFYKDQDNRKHVSEGQSFPKWCADQEEQQGKNIFEAAASIPALERLVYSSLTDFEKWTKGKYPGVVHFNSKAHAAEWAKENLPDVWAKTSIIQVGIYLTNFTREAIFQPTKDGDTYVWNLAHNSKKPWAFVDAQHDTGVITAALVSQPAGKNVIGIREYVQFNDFLKLLEKHLGIKTRVNTGGIALPDELKEEIEQTFKAVDEFGYTGGDPSVIEPKDLGLTSKELGTVEGWVRNHDWNSLLQGSSPADSRGPALSTTS